MKILPLNSDREERALLERWRGRLDCPPPDVLLPALEETVLPEETARMVRAHVDACPLCAELAAALREASASPTREAEARISDRLRRRTGERRHFPPLVLAAAAAVCLIATAAYLTRWMNRQDARPAPSGQLAKAEPSRPLPVLALAPPPIQLPPESLTLRSGTPDRYAAALEAALEPFVRADYQQAEVRLEEVARDNSDRPHPHFYLGVAKLLRGNPADALPSLERARELAGPKNSLYPEATWYLAVALEHSGRAESAVAPLGALCGGGSTRDAQACEGLRRLQVR